MPNRLPLIRQPRRLPGRCAAGLGPAGVCAAVLLSIAGCTGGGPMTSRPNDSTLDLAVIRTRGDLLSYRGQMITVRGTADNAASGASVRGPNVRVYVEKPFAWPGRRVGQPMTLRGRLTTRPPLPCQCGSDQSREPQLVFRQWEEIP